MLERTSAGVKRPRIEVKEIRIEGATAAVEVVTVAEGQTRVEDTIRLVREAGALPDLLAQRLSARSVASKSVFAIGPTPGDVAPASK